MIDERLERTIRERILRLLGTFPQMTATHIGQGIRPYNAVWRDVLHRMIDEGIVVHEQVVVPRHTGQRLLHTYRLHE